MTLLLQDIRISLPDKSGERLLFEIDKLLIGKGEAVTIMGASGSGKSSLLSYICGVLSGSFMAQGQVFLEGEDISHVATHQRRLGILFQSPLLFPHLTVAENLAFGLPADIAKAQRIIKVQQALSVAGLDDYGEKSPTILSGGEAARVALMRVLLSSPKALLLDEPFSALDSELRKNFRQFVLDESTRLGLPVLLVTHDKDDALAFGNQILKIGN